MLAPLVLVVVAAAALLVGVVARIRGAPTPLVAGSVGVGVLLAAAGVTFLMVGDDAGLADADTPALGWLVDHRDPTLTAVARTVSLVGGTVPTAGVGLLAAVALLVAGRRRSAACWAVAVLVGALAIRLLKVVVERPRPPVATRLAVETTASLPSGHSLMAALGLGLAAAAVALLAPAARVPAAVVAVVLTLAIGASRAYLGVHWTTDVVAGWLIGVAVALAARTAARAVDPAPGPRPAPAATRR